MKRTVHGSNSSHEWGKSKLSSFGAEKAKPTMAKPQGAERAKGLGNAPLLSTMAKSKTTRPAT